MTQEVEVTQQIESPPSPTETSAPVETAPTETQPAQGEPAPTPPPKTFTQSDLDRILSRERAQESRRAERLGYERAMRQAAEKQLSELRSPPADARQTGGKPTLDQFKDYDQFMEALTDWKVEQKLQKVTEQAKEQRAKAEAEKAAEEVRAKLATGTKKYADFEDVVLNEDVRVTRDMAEAILEMGSDGTDVGYFLGTHPEEAARIAGLSKVGQIREIDKLSATLKAPPKVTQAPPPIVPNSGTGSVEKRLEDASTDEFVKIRRRQIAAKRA